MADPTAPHPNNTWTVAVQVPITLPADMRHDLFRAVAAAAAEWEPDDRDGWDAEVYSYPTADPPGRVEPPEAADRSITTTRKESQ